MVSNLVFILLVSVLMTCTNAFYPNFNKRINTLSRRHVTIETTQEAPTEELSDRVINISPKAMDHILSLKAKSAGDMSLRMGVRAGGCSGMSYIMDMIPAEQINEDDHVEMYQGIQ